MTNSMPISICRGFTIIELLVTIVLVGILASTAIPMTELVVQRGREHELREALRTIRTAIDGYKQAGDEGRILRSIDESGYPRSLDELTGVPDLKDPKKGLIRFMRRVPQDPLNQEASLSLHKSWGIRSYASTHANPQTGKDVFDIYSLAPGKGLNGILYKDW